MSHIHALAMTRGQWASRLPEGIWQGHAVRCAVQADLPVGWHSFPGGEVEALHTQLESAVAPLHGQLTNEVIGHTGPTALLRWVHDQLNAQVPNIQRVAIEMSPEHGADGNARGEIFAWRRYRLRCAHYLPHVPLGHKCGRLHGHDFEVVVHTRVEAGVDAYARLDAAWAPLHFKLNYQRLNDIEGLGNPTSEVLSSWIWQALAGSLEGLSWVTVFETASCGANYDGVSHRIWKELSFDSATQLTRAPLTHPASRVHGHTYQLRLHLKGDLDQVMGWTIDFGDVKKQFAAQFAALDHQPLHDIFPEGDGGAVCWVRRIAEEATDALTHLERVTLLEGPTGGAHWSVSGDFLPLPL